MWADPRYLFIDHMPDVTKIRETMFKILQISKKLGEDDVHHTLIVYAGGHGSSDGQNQIYLLNSADQNKIFFTIEEKLRSIVEANEFLRVFAIYNCDRVLMEMPGLATLSDNTKVDGKSWKELRNRAMKPGFSGSKALKDYSKEDKTLFLNLFEAQKKQGDLKALKL